MESGPRCHAGRTSHLGLTNLKPGQTIVMMATEDSTRCYCRGG